MLDFLSSSEELKDQLISTLCTKTCNVMFTAFFLYNRGRLLFFFFFQTVHFLRKQHFNVEAATAKANVYVNAPARFAVSEKKIIKHHFK